MKQKNTKKAKKRCSFYLHLEILSKCMNIHFQDPSKLLIMGKTSGLLPKQRLNNKNIKRKFVDRWGAKHYVPDSACHQFKKLTANQRKPIFCSVCRTISSYLIDYCRWWINSDNPCNISYIYENPVLCKFYSTFIKYSVISTFWNIMLTLYYQ